MCEIHNLPFRPFGDPGEIVEIRFYVFFQKIYERAVIELRGDPAVESGNFDLIETAGIFHCFYFINNIFSGKDFLSLPKVRLINKFMQFIRCTNLFDLEIAS